MVRLIARDQTGERRTLEPNVMSNRFTRVPEHVPRCEPPARSRLLPLLADDESGRTAREFLGASLLLNRSEPLLQLVLCFRGGPLGSAILS
jgi:hypothetical protein